jgi:hypothetical protein
MAQPKNALSGLKEELGEVLTAQEVAEYLRFDVRTIRKYATTELGGVLIAGQLRFFDKRIKEVLNAQSLQAQRKESLARKCHGQRQDENKVVSRWQQKDLQARSEMGRGDAKKNDQRAECFDRHGIFS